MTSYERVHPDCVNASNPYHECGVACLEKISSGHNRKDKKKADYASGINGELRKISGGERRGNTKCPKSSNPYHECTQYCSNRIVKATPPIGKETGSIIGGSLSFRKKKIGSDSQLQSPGVVGNGALAKPARSVEIPSPRSPLSAKKTIDAYNSQSSTSSHPPSRESPENHSTVNDSVVHDEIVSASEIVTADSLASYAFGTLAKQKQNEKTDPTMLTTQSAAAVLSPVSKSNGSMSSVSKTFNFSFSGISQATENSEDEDSISVVSDSYISVGKYNVRPYLASTLQSILDKYGDIGANSCLESASLRSYHLECVCSIVQELESTPVNQLTRAKVKEMLAVLKDVEAAQVDVSWLRTVLNEHKDVIDLSHQYQTAEAGKVDCGSAIESVRKELELLEVELGQRELAVAATKSKIEESRCRWRELELESSELNNILSSAKAKLEKYHGKPLAERIL